MSRSVDLDNRRTSVIRTVVVAGLVGDTGGTEGATLATSVRAGVVLLNCCLLIRLRILQEHFKLIQISAIG